MADPLLDSYEAVPYDSYPIAASEIGALEAVALLFGVVAPPAHRARVLELGCASGANLIAMAHRYPEATFVGIDLTPGQIALGQKEVADLGFENITLHAMSISDVTDAFGTFDYVICHGVYSWVPVDVQEAILRVASRNLRATGIAYISYNTFPGWHVRGMVRDMVMYHDDQTLSPHDRIARANAFIGLIAEHGGTPTTPHTAAVAEEAMNLKAQTAAHFLHEQLEPYNSPVYFSEFVRRAATRKLRFLCEAKLADRATIPPDWAKRAAGADAGIVRVQQYVDFAIGRTFRRSLLCHDNVVGLTEPTPEAVSALHVALRAVPATPSDEDSAKSADVESFRSSTGATMTTNNPLLLAALHVLERIAPSSLPFSELLQRVNDRLSVNEPPGIPVPSGRAAPLSNVLLQCAFGGFVELHRYPSAFTRIVAERPVASRIARHVQPSVSVVPNLRHVMVQLTVIERAILCDLDGAHDRAQLVDRIIERLNAGEIVAEGPRPDRTELVEAVNVALERLASIALLEPAHTPSTP